MFQHVIRTDPGADGRGYDNVAGISVFFGKLGSAVVSSSFGALRESASETAFLRDFLAGVGSEVAASSASTAISGEDFLTPFFFEVADVGESVAFRFDFAGDGDDGATLAASKVVAVVAVRLEERRVGVLLEAGGAIVRRCWYKKGRYRKPAAVRGSSGKRERSKFVRNCPRQRSIPVKSSRCGAMVVVGELDQTLSQTELTPCPCIQYHISSW